MAGRERGGTRLRERRGGLFSNTGTRMLSGNWQRRRHAHIHRWTLVTEARLGVSGCLQPRLVISKQCRCVKIPGIVSIHIHPRRSARRRPLLSSCMDTCQILRCSYCSFGQVSSEILYVYIWFLPLHSRLETLAKLRHIARAGESRDRSCEWQERQREAEVVVLAADLCRSRP